MKVEEPIGDTELTISDYMEYIRTSKNLNPFFKVQVIINRDIPEGFQETMTNQCKLEGLL